MLNNHIGVTVIQRTSKRSNYTDRTNRDQCSLRSRMMANSEKIPYILSYLAHFTDHKLSHKRLLYLAEKITQISSLTIDRLAKRYRDALLCWFSQHWRKICLFLESNPSLIKTILEQDDSQIIKETKHHEGPLIDFTICEYHELLEKEMNESFF